MTPNSTTSNLQIRARERNPGPDGPVVAPADRCEEEGKTATNNITVNHKESSQEEVEEDVKLE